MLSANKLALRSDELRNIECDFAVAVIEGLSKVRKTLPCRFFYDARGSELFEDITRLAEYYPTRTEAGILHAHAAEMVQDIRDGDVLVEFGSGSSLKTQILLDLVATRVTYVPIDVSASALAEARDRLQNRYPGMAIRPIIADFSSPIELPPDLAARRMTGFFPGSTIGNLVPADAVKLLRVFKSILGEGGRLIIGVDLKKDPRTLVEAYSDAAGITAEFNLNLLARINRELDGTFDLASFRHEAIYNPREGRIEMHLVSTRNQCVVIGGSQFKFLADERIHTENSYKYTVPQFHDLARAAGWQPYQTWTDPAALFSVHSLRPVLSDVSATSLS